MSPLTALRSLLATSSLLTASSALVVACGGAAPPAEGPPAAGSASAEHCEHCQRHGKGGEGHGGCEHCRRGGAGHDGCAHHGGHGKGDGAHGNGHEGCAHHGGHGKGKHGAAEGSGHEGCSCPHHGHHGKGHAGPGGEGHGAPASSGGHHAGHHGPEGHGGHGGHPGPDHPMHQGGEHPRFDDPQRWSQVFDDPRRDEWQKPALVVEKLALRPDAVVADLGTGTGYFVPWLSRAVPKGKVLALDVEPAMVKHVTERARTASLGNVVAAVSTPTDPAFPHKPDMVLLVDTYHHIADRVPYFTRLRAGLAPRGRVAVVDFKMGQIPVGPPEAHRVAPEAVEKELGEAGFKRCASHDGLPYQYFLIFAEKC